MEIIFLMGNKHTARISGGWWWRNMQMTPDPLVHVQVNSIICAKNKSGENPEKKTRSRALK